MTERPLARLIATLALLVLGGIALARLPLDYFSRAGFPELRVGVALGEDRDPAEVSREWVEPVESAVRSLGGVRGAAGEVRTDGAELTVRFAPGTDAERKAARLDSELARLRAGLPEGAALWVETGTEREGDLLAIVWLTAARDDAGARAAAEAIRAVPGVRAVEPFGVPDEELRLELAGGAVDPWGVAEAVLEEARRSLQVPVLGWSESDERRLPVLAVAPGELTNLPIPLPGGAVPLASLGTLRTRPKPGAAEVRFQGRPARALYVWRATDAPPLAVDRALRERLAHLPAGVRGTVGWSEAEPLRALVRRLVLAGLLAAGLAAASGVWLAGRRGALALGLAIPAAVAAAANGFLLAGIPLNVTTLTALALAAGTALPLAAVRLTRRTGFWTWGLTATAAAAVVPVAVSIAGAELGPLLTEPARALLVATAAVVAAMALLPTFPFRVGAGLDGGAGARPALAAGILQPSLRDPGTAVLLATTAGYVVLALFGGALLPQRGRLAPDQGNLTLQLRLPQGSTLAETVQRTAKLEQALAKASEVERFWSVSTPGAARLTAELRSGARGPAARRLLATRLRYETAGAGAVEIAAGGRPSTTTGRGGGFLDDLEDRAETDEQATTYRVVLRGADLAAVRAGYDRLLQRLDTLKIRRHRISGWGDPAIHLVLRPRPGTPPAEAAEIAGRLRRESAPPPSLTLPGGLPGGPKRLLTAVPAGAPEDPDQAIPQLASLLGRPLRLGDRIAAPGAVLQPTEEVLFPRVARQSGRFVVPVEIRLPGSQEEGRKQRRRDIDRSLGQLPLPAACDLERPRLLPYLLQPDRLRIVALGLAMPLLLFVAGAIRLSSLARGVVCLVPLAVGLTAAPPLVSLSLGRQDELTLFALAASLALALPAATETAAADAASGGRLYRAVRRQAPGLFIAALTLVLALTACTLGLEPTAAPWAVPLRAAAVAGGAALAASLLLVPPLLLAGNRWRERDPDAARRRRRPPAWSEPGEPSLEVRSLTKIYGGKTAALSGVSFTLTPGIVGLLGPNGAGKTTLLRILTGLLEPSRGTVLYRGVPITPENLEQYRRRIGFLPQEFNAYPGFTAEQFLDHWAMERGLADPRQRRAEIERLLAAVGLAEHAGRKVRDYSGGMRQRVGIARALLAVPPILIVDEPTTGLDVESRSRFRQILLEQAGERVVVFSTHIASDVEAAARRILLLHRGKLRFDGTPEELAERARGRVFRALVGDGELAGFSRRYRVTSRVRVLEGIAVRAIAPANEHPAGEPVEPNLEEAYLAEIDLSDPEPALRGKLQP
jgi:ABC-2 type transport system ATP-binding protein